MILAIDGYEANAGIRVGIGRYAFEILKHIALRQQKDHVFDDVRVYVPGRVSAHMPAPFPGFTYRTIPVKPLWTFVGLPFSLFFDNPRADVVFSPTHYVPRFTPIPRVMAVMDVSYLTYPELFRPEDLHKLTNWTAYSVRHAGKILTISQFSKRAIIEAYHVPSERVVVAYPALPNGVMNTSMTGKNNRSLPKRYILSVGTLQPRKNFTKLIESMRLLADTTVHLVIVGKKGWLFEEILNAPETYGVADRVHFLDFVSDEELTTIYQKAECFVLPSLYEGFGLPVLEAMAHGVPVVVSRVSSLPEIAGEAGIYIDPSSAKSIAEGISAALSEPTKDRSQRVKLGISRAKEFTWEKAADQVMDVLLAVGKKGVA